MEGYGEESEEGEYGEYGEEGYDSEAGYPVEEGEPAPNFRADAMLLWDRLRIRRARRRRDIVRSFWTKRLARLSVFSAGQNRFGAST